MSAEAKDTTYEVLLNLLRKASTSKSPAWLLEQSMLLSRAIGGVPQAEVARRIGRSVPAVRRLVESETIHLDANHRIPAIEAAFLQLQFAAMKPGSRRLVERIVALADWLNELSDPRFTTALEQMMAGKAEIIEPLRPASEVEADAAEYLAAASRGRRDGETSAVGKGRAAIRSRARRSRQAQAVASTAHHR